MATNLRRIFKRADGKVAPLYVRRNVTNADAIIQWAKAQGFETCVPGEEMHATIVFSREPMDWTAAGDSYDQLKAEGDQRSVEPLGDKGAVVLKFELAELSDRWQQFRDEGASWDFPGYQPHVTITYNGTGIDLSKVEPYAGPIEFGPEIYEDFNDDWKDGITEKAAKFRLAKVDEELGIVWGWAIICSIDGEPYYDLNIDREGPHKGQRVPENIPNVPMTKGALSFALSHRPGNEMHKGPDVGVFPFIMPITHEIAKAAGMTTRIEGLLVGYMPPADVLAKFKTGDYSGFSIEGWVFDAELLDA